MKKFLITCLALVPALLFAQTDNRIWIKAGETSDLRDEFRAGSQKIVANDSNEEVISVQGRRVDKTKNTITFHLWYVSTADCQRNFGKIYALSMSGEVQSSGDWVPGGGNLGSSKAELICLVYRTMKAPDQKKGIPPARFMPDTPIPMPGEPLLPSKSSV